MAQEQQGGSGSADLLSGLGIDEHLARGGSTFLRDALGSTVALASSGAIQTSYGYDPQGVAQVTGTASDNSFQFTGRENDGTGLLFYRARYYNPTWGRFISEDPIGFAGGDADLYRYVADDPIGRNDPLGLILEQGIGGASSADASPSAGPCGNNSAQAQFLPPLLDTPPLIFDEPPAMIRPPLEDFPADPTQPPGPGYEWRGAPGSSPGSSDGNWYNPNTGESLRPDMNHPEPIGPHYDYRAPNGNWYRWFPNGGVAPKA